MTYRHGLHGISLLYAVAWNDWKLGNFFLYTGVVQRTRRYGRDDHKAIRWRGRCC